MKKPVVVVLVALTLLALAPLTYAYQIDRNILLTYGDSDKNYTETYFDTIIKGIDVSSLTSATLTVHLDPAVSWKWPTAKIWVNGDVVKSSLEVKNSTAWTYDVLSDLQDDGGLTFKLEKRSGKVSYLGAELDVTPDAAHNPIPATLWLFGAGLIGLAGVRMRLKK